MIPSYCPNCGNLFQSRAFHFSGNVGQVTLQGNRETCPRCGRWANIADGVFEITHGALRLIQGSRATQDMLDRFAEMLQQANDGKLSPSDLEERAADLKPELGQAVAEMRRGSGTLWSAAVLVVLTALTGCKVNLNADVDLNRLVDQAVEIATGEPLQSSLPQSGGKGPKSKQDNEGSNGSKEHKVTEKEMSGTSSAKPQVARKVKKKRSKVKQHQIPSSRARWAPCK